METPEITPEFEKVAPGYNMQYAKAILIGLQRRGNIYEGTVSLEEKEKRRARNKRARAARRANKI